MDSNNFPRFTYKKTCRQCGSPDVFKEKKKVGFRLKEGWYCRRCGKWEFGSDANKGQRRRRKSKKYLCEQWDKRKASEKKADNK